MNQPQLPDELLTTEQVGIYLRVTPDVVRAWIRSGKLTALRLGPTGPYRVRPEDIAALLRA
jgi:excisionase family DNA binding protein